MERARGKQRWAVSLWLAIFLATGWVGWVHAESAASTYLRSHIASLQQILCDPQLAGKERLLQRRKLERIILEQLFDFDEMARRSLGVNARKYNDRMTEFTPLFIDFLEHAYMGTLEENGDAKVQYVGENGGAGWAEINTRTRLSDGRLYSVDYKLLLGTRGWRAYDVVVQGVGLVENYRSQFERVLRQKSFDELLQDLQEKKQRFD